MSNSFTYIDRRFGISYTVHFNDDGSFACVLAYVDRVGAEPIVYHSLAELPPSIRNELESRIPRFRK